MSIFLETKRLILKQPILSDFNELLQLRVAQKCFKKFHGIWEVIVIPGKEGAYQFWRSTIKNYTNNNFTEYTRDIVHFNNSRKNIFKFDSRITL